MRDAIPAVEIMAMERVMSERDELRAEVERLRDATPECVHCAGRDTDTEHWKTCEAHPARKVIERLREALEFYADPDTYFAWAFMGDPPCGDFGKDFSDAVDSSGLEKCKPGKRARAVLRPWEGSE